MPVTGVHIDQEVAMSLLQKRGPGITGGIFWQCNSALTFFCYLQLFIIVTLSLKIFFPFSNSF